MGNAEEIRSILGQMTMLSLVTDQAYGMRIPHVGHFAINQQHPGDGCDVVWTDETGTSHIVTRENIEWLLYELNLTQVEDYLPEENNVA